MCGRSRCTLAPEEVVRTAGTARWVNREQYQPSYNVSPGFATPVVLMGQDGPQVQTMRWGLVPSFAKKDDKLDFWRMFNARSESVTEKPVFRRLLPTRRCLVVLEGFYEWLKEKGGAKQPYYIHLAGGEPLVMAGLYDGWEGPEGTVHTYTILTSDSSKRLEWLHDRMPVILRGKQAQQLWLHTEDKSALGKLQQLCAPYNGEDLVWYPVTRQMNTPSFQGPECCKEVKKPKVQDFFKPKPGAAAAAAPAATAAPPAGAEGKQEAAAAAGQQRERQQPAAASQLEAAVKMEGEGAAPLAPAAAAGQQHAAGPLVEKEESEEQHEQHEQQAEAAELEGQLRSGGAPASVEAAAAINADERPLDTQQAAAAAAVAAAGEPAAEQAAGAGAATTPKRHQQQRKQQASKGGTPKQPQQQSKASPQKRKQPASSGGGDGGVPAATGGGATGKASGSPAKKAKPAGQQDITKFFGKA